MRLFHLVAPWPASAWILTVASLVSQVSANTEIVNIVTKDTTDVVIRETSKWPVLAFETPEQLWKVQPAPLNTRCSEGCTTWDAKTTIHEQWAVLDFDSPAWLTFRKFTLRISWPAFHPTDFHIHTFSPEETRVLIHDNATAPDRPVSSHWVAGKTRRQYARIRLVDTGIRPPSKRPIPTQPTPFVIILEPLYFGILPASVFPTALFLMPVVFIAFWFVVPLVHDYMRQVAADIPRRTEPAPRKKAE